jgi:hypothetical protein
MAEAHIELAKAEFAGISDNLKIAAALVGLAIATAIFAAILISIGTTLFLGEWLFGSLGWGVVDGALISLAIIVVAAGLLVKPEGTHVGRDLAVAIIGTVLLSIVFALGLTNQAWQAVTDALNLGLDEAYRLLAVALSISVIVFAILGGIVGAWRGGGRSVGSGLVLGVFFGLAFGAFTALDPGTRVGIALGVMFGLIIFIVLVATDLARGGIDEERLKARFMPTQTIATTKETIEWLQSQSPTGPEA